ncbi:putative laccase-9 [Syzygium oleosum]|uniref:putative laccase-9 n=1 Tax=Syzygium oleosum TaxID=219896 RepID=UPI0024B8A39E|nr:putative laccase-9 [Syzygium oleosum]
MGSSLCELPWLLALLGGLLLLLPRAQGEDHYYTFVLRETNFTRMCVTKSMLTVNESFPGPTLYVRKGDTVYVNVINEGYYGVTIHWHGIKQPRNPWFDGPEYVTQCPIPPGTNFTYQVLFTSEEGTLWWHAHSDWTRATVHGAIVIKPALGTTYPFLEPDDEKVLVFASWYDEDVMELMKEALSEGGLTTLSDAYCINGQPGDFYNCSRDSTHRISVDYGKTYLLRLVSSVQNTDMYFAIANHTLTVVGWDGAYVKPVVTSYIMITPGQAMDILVTADQPLGEYYILLSPFFDGQADDFDHSIASAIFQYNGNYSFTGLPAYPSDFPGWEEVAPATSFVKRLKSLNSAEHPIDVPTDDEITTRMFITVSISMMKCPNASCEGPDGNRLASALNNISFANPDLDVLQAYYSNIAGYYTADFPDLPPTLFNFTSDDLLTDNETLSDQGTKVKVLNYNETVEIIFQGTNVMNSGETHPMHLHGFRFYVVGLGGGNFDNETDPETYNLYDPPEANTVPVPKDGWAVIRFRADNPGVWYMHCHFDRHMAWGMDTVFIVKNGTTAETSIREPPVYMPPCETDSSLLTALRSYLRQQA